MDKLTPTCHNDHRHVLKKDWPYISMISTNTLFWVNVGPASQTETLNRDPIKEYRLDYCVHVCHSKGLLLTITFNAENSV